MRPIRHEGRDEAGLPDPPKPPLGEGEPEKELPPGMTITKSEAGTEVRYSSTDAENAKVERKREAAAEEQRKARLEGLFPNAPIPPEPGEGEGEGEAKRD